MAPNRAAGVDETSKVPARGVPPRRFRVMLVDDDRLALQDLRDLICWEDLDCKIVAEARNGKDALRKAYETHPDIVLDDIRMPVMDGLELSSELLHHNPCTRVLLLTAYRDFAYAKEAVRIGVSGFVLKNELDAESLKAEVGGLKAGWMTASREHGAAVREQMKWFARDIRNGGESAAPPEPATRPGALSVLIVAVNTPMSSLVFEKDAPDMPADHLLRDGVDRIDVLDEFEVAHLRDNVFFGLARVERVFSSEELHRHSGCLARALQRVVRATTGLSSSVFYATLDHHSHDALTDSVRALLSNASLRFTVVDNVCVELADSPMPVVDAELLAAMERKRCELMQAVADGEAGDFERLYRELFQIGANGHLSDRTVSTFVEYLANLFEPTVSDGGLNGRDFSGRAGARAVLREELHQFLRTTFRFEQLETLGSFLFSRRGGADSPAEAHRYSRRVRSAVRYIQENYPRNIGVPDIAETAGLSVPRFSALFRDETGSSPAGYLAEVRVEHACRLLVETNLKIGEVASAVGYHSAQYFSRVLRERTGRTPGEYREEHAP